MSTLDAKPAKAKILNTKLLVIAAAILLVLALLFLATPLLRSTGTFQGRGTFNPQINGRTLPGGQEGFPDPGGVPQGFPDPNDSNVPEQQIRRPGGLMSFSLFGGMGGTIVYAIALVISLVAALGMFMAKRWGQILGIIMAVIYGLLSIIGLLPLLLISFMGILSPLTLILGILKLVLAVAVIVLASIPGKKATPAVPAAPAAPAM